MAPRKAISKKLRFEVFKRDNFTCQYCGKSAPDVVLHLDHINPVAKGGGPDILNLVTSCADCNSGKSDRLLNDKTMLEKQKKQLAELNERREQLKLMVKWREGLKKLDDLQVNEIEKIMYAETGRCLSEYGRGEVAKWIKKYGFPEVLESAGISRHQYLQDGNDESLNKMFNYIPRICSSRKYESKNPHLKQLYYIRAIVRNTCSYCNEKAAIIILQNAYDAGVPIDEIKDMACSSRNWTSWKLGMEELVEIYSEEQNE